MKWSTALVVSSMGMRTTGDHAVPLDEVLMTISDDIIGCAPAAEAAVLPHHVHPPGPVDFGGRQRRRPQVACHRMRQDGCDPDRASVTQTSVGRRDGPHA